MAGNFRSFDTSSSSQKRRTNNQRRYSDNQRGRGGGNYQSRDNKNTLPVPKLVFNTTEHFLSFGDNDCKKHIDKFIERSMDKFIYNCPKGYDNPDETDDEFKSRCDKVCANLVCKYKPCSTPTRECSRLGQDGHEEHEKCEWLRQNDYVIYFPNGEPPKPEAPKIDENSFPAL